MARRKPAPLETRVEALARSARIPCLAAPYDDELLSSWLERCAVSHGMESSIDFVAGVLRFEGMRPLSWDVIDLDTETPPRLIAALARRTAVCEQQLMRMMVKKGPHVLFRRHRDAYCPRCFKEDVERRAIYTRRRWIDSWCVQCEVHGCLLGAYVHPPSVFGAKKLPDGLPPSEQRRLGTTHLGTVAVFNPRLDFWEETSAVKRKPSRPRWLDPSMLRSPLGRSLMLLCGSTVGEHVERAVLSSFGREKHQRWFDDHRRIIDWPDAQHPWSTVLTRVRAAYVAAACWQAIDHSLGVPADTGAWLQVLSTKGSMARGRRGRPGWRAWINPDWRDTSEEDAIRQESTALLRLRGTRYFNDLVRRVIDGM
jgi:TniQ